MKPSILSEKSFFNLQLSSSLAFTSLLALILTAFFIYSQWHSYLTQSQAFRKSFSDTQFSMLNEAVTQEKNYIESLIGKRQFDVQQQHSVLERLRQLRIGPNKNGYFFVLKLNSINGGEDFARHLLLPIDPSQEGQPMSSHDTDSQGNYYRKDYLHQLKEHGKAEARYWYDKPGSDFASQKISVIYWIKPVNWIVGAGLYLDDLESVIHEQEQQLRKAFFMQAATAFLMTLLFLIIATSINLYLQGKLKIRFAALKSQLTESQKQLEDFNLNLEKEVAQKTRELENLYQRDPLTGLFNRSKLLSDLEKHASASPTKGFILIDIDGFKELNDLFGNEMGDRLLVCLAKNLQTLIPDTREVYRVGGDEFLVWVNALPDETERRLLELHHSLTENLQDNDLQPILFSITIVAAEESSQPLSTLEMTMRHAKNKKKDVLLYSPLHDQHQLYMHNLNTTQLLKRAIAEERIIPVFQPLLNLKTGQIDKYECLIRIADGEQLMPPGKFLEVAKKSKLYAQMTGIMLQKSFAKFAESTTQFSINLSYEDIVGEEIPRTLERLLTPGIAPRVTFEILETEGIENYEQVSAFIHKVKALGCRIAIDDYGTGYSNLEHLLKLQIDILKIDGSLIESLPQPHALAIVQSIVFFAKQLNITTVAEFVSSADIYEWVNKLGIDYAQGYYVGRPLSTLQTTQRNSVHTND
ncbi:EAL domain-containing protein [Thiomicrorhabdus cannonii]|uniref:EAL domain-containing protein n=1 Tax=Thiomicrorhabdus cannonii TaxID=2748011 RepID=UPI0015B7A5F1|nr:EAL domain-containing protein [Thiomicrorhabdus cannonii]